MKPSTINLTKNRNDQRGSIRPLKNNFVRMNKVIICLAGCVLLTGKLLQAQDSTKLAQDGVRQVRDTAIQIQDSTKQVRDTTIQTQDSAKQARDTIIQTQDSTKQIQDAPKQALDTTRQEGGSTKRELDTRWFISPLLKFQFQDFGMLEKNRKGYLSDANTLPIEGRGNLSFAASAYKNITERLSVSADIGLSFGHVTNDNVLVSKTKSKTYNLLNATFYYHLLNSSYRLQPFLSVGINDIINDASYASAPIGIGAKFNAKKIMVMGQFMYGYALSKNMSNTTMYSLGVYLPIKNKKSKKQAGAEDTSPYNRPGKDKDKKKDTSSAKSGNIVNNIYITINMDSVLNARRGKNGEDGRDGDNSQSPDKPSSSGKRGGGLKSFNLQDFSFEDFQMDTVNGLPVIKFVIYFEFNEYSLTSRAFSSIDKVIDHLRHARGNFAVEIKGYTDDIGTNEYNNFLSRRRAKMVYDYMNSRGVPAELMKAKAYGSDNPVADNKDPNSAWLNRRAEIRVREK